MQNSFHIEYAIPELFNKHLHSWLPIVVTEL